MEQMKIMNKWYVRTFPVAALGLLLALSACRPSYEVVRVEGTRAAIDSTWDARPDAEAVALLVPYKQQVDSVMQQVLGTAALTMEPYRPESLLSNLVADILREAASDVTLRQLFENIAYRLGEGVSGVTLEVSKDRKLISATIGGKPVEDDKTYTVATVDYLAEGNDGMTALPQAESKVCPPGATLRSLFIDYVKRQAKAGKAVTSRMEGRIVVKE